jgi:hypothetical protein
MNYRILELIIIIVVICYWMTNINEYLDLSDDIFNQNIKKNYLNTNLPHGAWRDTCRITDWRPPILWSDCKNYFGHYKSSSINLSSCYNESIENVDGFLKCKLIV